MLLTILHFLCLQIGLVNSTSLAYYASQSSFHVLLDSSLVPVCIFCISYNLGLDEYFHVLQLFSFPNYSYLVQEVDSLYAVMEYGMH
jgi:hypothetical protein